MRKIDTTAVGSTPTFFKTAIIASAFMGLIFTSTAQNNYTASIGDSYCELSSANDVQPINTSTATVSKTGLQTSLKELYTEQVALTHTLMQNILDNSANMETTKLALVQNQENIAKSMIPFYGPQAVNVLSVLLYKHVTLTADMVIAVRDGDIYGIDEAVDAWKLNGNQIAAFVNQSNPSISLSESKLMVRNYLKTTVMMGEAIYKGNITAEMKAYNKVVAASMVMQNKITTALINNHPDQFGSDDAEPMVTMK